MVLIVRGGSEPNPMGGLTLEVAICFIDLIMKLKSGFFWAKLFFPGQMFYHLVLLY